MSRESRLAGPSRSVPFNSPFLPPASPIPTSSTPHRLSILSDQHSEEILDVIPSRAGRSFCVRHKQMANQEMNNQLQKNLDSIPLSERSAVTQLWSTFSNSPHAKRRIILEGILNICCSSQLSHLSNSLSQITRMDPFTLLPRELNMRILGYLDAISLGRAAQVSKTWKAVADDDLVWRRLCGQHIDRKCQQCGWGLPLLERKRLKVELKDRSPAVAMGVGGHEHGHATSKVMTRVEALAGKAREIGTVAGSVGTRPLSCDPAVAASGVKRSAHTPPLVTSNKKTKLEGSDSESELSSTGSMTREVRMTRPWKTVYCERLAVERNWRKGRCNTRTLKGHTDGIMCLQYHMSLSSPSYPVLITGSYDRTLRVWNLDTGLEVRVLRGHTRAVRALQFDQMLLFTGAMDGTIRMWNWRAGDCLRVLEGHTDGVVALNYNGYLLASGSADSTIQVWNFRTGNKFSLLGHDDWVNSVVLWDGKTSPSDIDPTQVPSFTRHRNSLSPTLECNDTAWGSEIDTGAMLFSASDDGTIKLWDLVQQSCVRTFDGHKAQVQSLRVIMVDMSEAEIAAAHLQVSDQGSPPRVAFGLTPPNTLSPSSPGSTDKTGPHPKQRKWAADGDPSPNGCHALGSSEERKTVVHSADEHHKSSSGNAGDKSTQRKPLIASGSLDGTVKIWDVDTGNEQSTLFGHIEGVWAVDIDALRLASASHDRTVKVWDRQSGKCEQTLVGHRGAVTSLQLSDDMIVSGSDDGDVMVWSFAPSADDSASLMAR